MGLHLKRGHSGGTRGNAGGVAHAGVLGHMPSIPANFDEKGFGDMADTMPRVRRPGRTCHCATEIPEHWCDLGHAGSKDINDIATTDYFERQLAA